MKRHIKILTSTMTVFFVCVNSSKQSTYIGVTSLPGTVQAENYDNDSSNNGGAYRDGSVDIEGTSDASEWLEYMVNVAYTGNYTFNVRVATPNDGC